MLGLVALTPGAAVAFSLSALWPSVEAATPATQTPSTATPALRAALNADPNPLKGTDLAIAGGVALLPQSGPSGTMADIGDTPQPTQISIYVVRAGDSLSKIGKLYGVSPNTILWANNLDSARDIHPGDTLVILPVSGVEHTVSKGETLASIVKKYKGDMQEVLDFNHLTANTTLAVGDTVIIPDGIDASTVIASPSSSKGSSSATSYEPLIRGAGGPAIPGYFTRPLAGGVMTQGLHGYNAVDMGVPVGTRVSAAAGGTVIIARSSGYNGGYGEYIVIQHPNGTQTVYGHLSKIYVTSGSHVDQGELIALSGNTGRSTGPHLHFEVRGAANPYMAGF